MNIGIFGGTGGLGSQLTQFFPDATFLGSKDVDISKEGDVRDFFATHNYDVVVNLSGYNADGFIHRIESKEIDKMIDVNVRGTLNLLRFALPSMRKKKFGRIILVSSYLSTAKDVLGTGVYSATKSFIDGIVKNVAAENAREQITCNAIRLGYFDGGMTHKIENWETLKYSIPMRRLGRPEELAKTIQFLINTEYVTGTCIDITGGA